MKTFFITLIVLCFAAVSFADQWCQWSVPETKGVDCQSDSRGYIRIEGFKVKTPSIANNAGWYRLIVTQPAIGDDQTRDAEVWGFADNEISRTWTVRDLTAEELDQRSAGPLDITMYYLLKGLMAKDVFTLQEARNFFPQETIDAYQARSRLEE